MEDQFTTPAEDSGTDAWPVTNPALPPRMTSIALDALVAEIHEEHDAFVAEKLAELTQEIPPLLFGPAIFEAWSKAHRGDLYVPPRRGRHHRVQRRSLVVLAAGVAAFVVGVLVRGRDPR